jgi:N-acetylmuramoyl-L-alanine amidase
MTDEKMILIDNGHGGDDPGAMHDPTPGKPGDETEEEDITLEVGLHFADILRVDGYQCIMTRDRDESVSLSARLSLIRKFQPAAFISIHCNSWTDPSRRGIEVYYRDDEDRRLAESMYRYLTMFTGMRAKGVHQDVERLGKRLTVLNDQATPSCLVELGYLSNDLDRKYITGNMFTLAQLLAFGVMDYFKDPKLSTYIQDAMRGGV